MAKASSNKGHNSPTMSAGHMKPIAGRKVAQPDTRVFQAGKLPAKSGPQIATNTAPIPARKQKSLVPKSRFKVGK